MSEFTPFVTARPGQDQGRIQPRRWPVPNGDWVAVLGSDAEGYEDRSFNVGDYIEIAQSDTVDAAAKMLRIATRIRGSGRMPTVSGPEPFALADGWDLTVKVKQGAEQTITFDAADFANIGAATAAEVRDAINAQLTDATAIKTGTKEVAIYPDRTGFMSFAEITGGTASTAFSFVTLSWFFKLLIDGLIVVVREVFPGQTLDLTDVAANLAQFAGGPANIHMVLELGQLGQALSQQGIVLDGSRFIVIESGSGLVQVWS